MDCGYSLVGDRKIVELEVVNNGGDGRFILWRDGEENPIIDWNEVRRSLVK